MNDKHFIYAYDSEPAIDPTTGFPRTDGSTSSSTAPAPWSAGEHSTFEHSSHSFERVQARGTRQDNKYVITTVLLAVAAVSTVVVAVFY